ncbi:hypothetical protein BHU72_10265 [Desulfuribacillus stibiiarsenatis]|uniref:SAM-dependent methyltransferase n=1 Tax=Desulfuribacillus stibiiarsenatis TaxID=1390249 RepID=A0A1E5L906_9FIRM|nr:SAM-dependent methyltransferase [Desulfuribacillus stibiiarsenatis]OEH86630.1 hypothetical protein BHU72_10265 [Desulfuribacillus stibiiarsenatis]
MGNEQLIHIIKNRINQEGPISFKDFMDMCLYYPKLGYYQADRERTGKQGDFYTSANVSPIFGEVIASYIKKLWERLECPKNFKIVEFGAGKGQLAHAILGVLSNEQELYASLQYYIIDASESFRHMQQQLLQGYPVKWVNSLEEIDNVVGCILSNELFDAFPVHIVQMIDNQLHEKFVTYNPLNREFEFQLKAASIELCEFFNEQKVILINHQEAEVNLQAKQWIQQSAKYLNGGDIITIDYGYTADEIYAPARMTGTLQCYNKHQVSDNTLVRIGLQDITSHVNFSQLIQWGEVEGLQTVSYQTQHEFLMQNGILDKLSQNLSSNPFDPIFKRNNAIKQLIMPGGMGDTFKVLIQRK